MSSVPEDVHILIKLLLLKKILFRESIAIPLIAEKEASVPSPFTAPLTPDPAKVDTTASIKNRFRGRRIFQK